MNSVSVSAVAGCACIYVEAATTPRAICRRKHLLARLLHPKPPILTLTNSPPTPRPPVTSPHLRRSSSREIVSDLRRIRLRLRFRGGWQTFEQADEPGRRVERSVVVVERRVQVCEEVVHYPRPHSLVRNHIRAQTGRSREGEGEETTRSSTYHARQRRRPFRLSAPRRAKRARRPSGPTADTGR